MNLDRMRGIIEAIIFASERPVSVDMLVEVFEDVGKKELETLLESMVAEWRSMAHGFQLIEVAGGWQFRTRPEMASWLQRMRKERPSKLSRAALEAMSIIAYKQPITRPEVEDLRGVDSAGVVRNLLERGLIKIIGKKDAPGKPVVYGTTERFLEVFSLRDLGSLPSLRDLKELEDDDAEQLDLPVSSDGEGATGGDGEPVDDSDRRRKIRDNIRGMLSDAVVRPDEPLQAADTDGLPGPDDDEDDVLSELEAALARRKEVAERTNTLLDDSEKDYVEKVTASLDEDPLPTEHAQPAGEASGEQPPDGEATSATDGQTGDSAGERAQSQAAEGSGGTTDEPVGESVDASEATDTSDGQSPQDKAEAPGEEEPI